MSRVRVLIGVLALVGASCSDDNPGPQDPGDPYLLVTATPPVATMTFNSSAVFQIAVTRGGFYQGAITLTAEGLPASLVATFQPSPLTGTTDRSTLTISIGTGATAGTYNFVVRAKGPGVDDAVSSQLTAVVTQ